MATLLEQRVAASGWRRLALSVERRWIDHRLRELGDLSSLLDRHRGLLSLGRRLRRGSRRRDECQVLRRTIRRLVGARRRRNVLRLAGPWSRAMTNALFAVSLTFGSGALLWGL
jgi:hypothetical protein